MGVQAVGWKGEWVVISVRPATTYLLITILRRRVTSLYMRHCALEECVQCTKSGGVYLVVELGLRRLTRVLCGDSRNESKAQ